MEEEWMYTDLETDKRAISKWKNFYFIRYRKETDRDQLKLHAEKSA